MTPYFNAREAPRKSGIKWDALRYLGEDTSNDVPHCASYWRASSKGSECDGTEVRGWEGVREDTKRCRDSCSGADTLQPTQDVNSDFV